MAKKYSCQPVWRQLVPPPLDYIIRCYPAMTLTPGNESM